MKTKLIYCLLALVCLPLSQSFANWHEHTFQVMGTQARVELWSEDPVTAKTIIEQVQQEMNRIDSTMSPYIPTSELSTINRNAYQNPMLISNELFDLLTDSIAIAEQSQGAFDITYASVGYQYDYRNKQKPNDMDIQNTLAAINYHDIVLNNKTKTVSFKSKNTKIDLGGIAKGHAVKRCLAIIRSFGIEHALVSAGGDTGLLGDRRGRPWIVGIKHPRVSDKMTVHLPLENEAISTSGDYERYFIEDGVRYHHILNPKTGKSAKEVISVSVIGKDPTMVDALSTTLFVLGLEQGMQLIDRLVGYEAIIIDNQQRLHFSTGLAAAKTAS